MAYSVSFTATAERDLDLIFEFLFETHLGVGESNATAFARAAARVRSIRTDGDSIGKAPFRGTLDDSILPGLRHVTINRAIFYFDVDEVTEEVRILAVFFGGQDHRRRMLARLLSG